MERRDALRWMGAASALAIAGCLVDGDTEGSGSGPNDKTTPTETLTPDQSTPTSTPPSSGSAHCQPGESYEVNDIAVTVSDLAVRHGMVTFNSVHPDPKWVDGAQFILATLTVEGDRDPANLDVTATTNTLDERPSRYFGFDPDSSESVQPLGFAVPTDPVVSEAAVVWNGPREVRCPLPEDLVAKLGRAPDFSLEGFRAPETAQDGEDFDVELDVANSGDRDGYFLAELGNGAMSDQPEIEVSVPAGEVVTATRSVGARFSDSRMEVVLRWEGGIQQRSIAPA